MAAEKWTPDRRRQLTRTALVEAAGEVFARRGFHGASLDEIAETAGFTRGAIYKNFTDKEDLFFAVCDQFNERVLRGFAEQLAQGAAASFDAQALAAIWQRMHRDDPDFFALGLEFRLYEIRNPEARARSAAHQKRTRQMVAEFIERNAVTNGLRLRVPSETLAAILLATSDGFALSAPTEPANRKLYEAFLELIIPATITDTPKRQGGRPRHRKPSSRAP